MSWTAPLPALGTLQLSAVGPRVRLAAGIFGVGVGYWLLAKLGSAAQYAGGVQVAWLPAGFAAAMLYLGDMRWAIGAVAADLILGAGLVPFHSQLLLHDPTVVVQTVGNTLEFLIAAVLMRRWLGRDSRLERPVEIACVVAAFALAEPVSALLGALSAWWGGYVDGGDVPTFFRTWMLADATGAMLIAPLLLVWTKRPLPSLSDPRRTLEAAGIVAVVVGVSIAAFDTRHPLTYVIFPVLILAAVRLGQRGATAALAITFAVAIRKTAGNAGPFAARSIDDEVLNTQLFMLVATITTLTIGAAVSAQRRAGFELAESRRRELERAAEERRRIAHDLHDSVSQTLFSLGLHAGIAKHAVASTELPDDSRLPGAVDEVAELAQGALLEMRGSIFALRGEAVAEQGLVAALGAHAIALSVRHDVRVGVEGPDDRLPVTPALEELLFRIGKEAITNAVKHSGSDSVTVRVTVDPDEVVLGVRDDGVGFDPSRGYRGHLGLELIDARAREAGGVATIDSAPGNGTTVRVALPALRRPVPPAPPAPPAAPPGSAS